jgi:hypothetical protein
MKIMVTLFVMDRRSRPSMVTLRLVVRPVLSKPLAIAGDERGQDISWSQLAHPMVGTIPTPHGANRVIILLTPVGSLADSR